jgi:hypothetical protein
MNMDEYVQMWEDICDESKQVNVPAQLNLGGEMVKTVELFGSRKKVYEYFKKVRDAEPPTTHTVE